MRSITKRAVLIGGVVAGALLFLVLGYYVASMDLLSPMAVSYQEDQVALSAPQAPVPDISGPSGGVVGDAAKLTKQQAAAESSSGSPVVSSESLVITVASLELRVEDVDAAVEQVRRAARATGAEIANLTLSAGSAYYDQEYGTTRDAAPGSAVITLRVAPESLDRLESAIAQGGDVISQSANSDDVTEQAIDLKARLKNLRAQEATLRTFLDRTTKVTELLEVERELARVRGEIESMDAQLTFLERQASRATLTVSLVEPDPLTPSGGVTWDLRQALARGVAITAGMLTALVTLAIPLGTVAILVFVAVVTIRAIVRGRRRRMARTTSQDTPPSQESS